MVYYLHVFRKLKFFRCFLLVTYCFLIAENPDAPVQEILNALPGVLAIEQNEKRDLGPKKSTSKSKKIEDPNKNNPTPKQNKSEKSLFGFIKNIFASILTPFAKFLDFIIKPITGYSFEQFIKPEEEKQSEQSQKAEQAQASSISSITSQPEAGQVIQESVQKRELNASNASNNSQSSAQKPQKKLSFDQNPPEAIEPSEPQPPQETETPAIAENTASIEAKERSDEPADAASSSISNDFLSEEGFYGAGINIQTGRGHTNSLLNIDPRHFPKQNMLVITPTPENPYGKDLIEGRRYDIIHVSNGMMPLDTPSGTSLRKENALDANLVKPKKLYGGKEERIIYENKYFRVVVSSSGNALILPKLHDGITEDQLYRNIIEFVQRGSDEEKREFIDAFEKTVEKVESILGKDNWGAITRSGSQVSPTPQVENIFHMVFYRKEHVEGQLRDFRKANERINQAIAADKARYDQEAARSDSGPLPEASTSYVVKKIESMKKITLEIVGDEVIEKDGQKIEENTTKGWRVSGSSGTSIRELTEEEKADNSKIRPLQEILPELNDGKPYSVELWKDGKLIYTRNVEEDKAAAKGYYSSSTSNKANSPQTEARLQAEKYIPTQDKRRETDTVAEKVDAA